MKTYTVYFSEPVTMKYKGDRFNKELKKVGTRCGLRRDKPYVHLPFPGTCKEAYQGEYGQVHRFHHNENMGKR